MEFVAVQDPEPARRREAERVYGVRSFESFSEMLRESRLDVVAIAAPTRLHRPMTLEALRAGCHVMLEKPMTPDSADAAAIVREAALRRRVLTVYQPRRAAAYFRQLMALVASGIIGDVYHMSGFDLNPLFIQSAKRGDYFYVKGGIDHGSGLINVNATDALGNSALHYAMGNHDERMVRLLVASGADVGLRNAEGMTPATMGET